MTWNNISPFANQVKVPLQEQDITSKEVVDERDPVDIAEPIKVKGNSIPMATGKALRKAFTEHTPLGSNLEEARVFGAWKETEGKTSADFRERYKKLKADRSYSFKLRGKLPIYRELMTDAEKVSYDDFVLDRFSERQERYQDNWDNTNGISTVAYGLGYGAGVLADPSIIASMGIGGASVRGAKALYTVGRWASKEALIAMTVEASLQPELQASRKRLGDPNAGFRAGAESVALAGAAGLFVGALGGLVSWKLSNKAKPKSKVKEPKGEKIEVGILPIQGLKGLSIYENKGFAKGYIGKVFADKNILKKRDMNLPLVKYLLRDENLVYHQLREFGIDENRYIAVSRGEDSIHTDVAVLSYNSKQTRWEVEGLSSDNPTFVKGLDDETKKTFQAALKYQKVKYSKDRKIDITDKEDSFYQGYSEGFKGEPKGQVKDIKAFMQGKKQGRDSAGLMTHLYGEGLSKPFYRAGEEGKAGFHSAYLDNLYDALQVLPEKRVIDNIAYIKGKKGTFRPVKSPRDEKRMRKRALIKGIERGDIGIRTGFRSIDKIKSLLRHDKRIMFEDKEGVLHPISLSKKVLEDPSNTQVLDDGQFLVYSEADGFSMDLAKKDIIDTVFNPKVKNSKAYIRDRSNLLMSIDIADKALIRAGTRDAEVVTVLDFIRTEKPILYQKIQQWVEEGKLNIDNILLAPGGRYMGDGIEALVKSGKGLNAYKGELPSFTKDIKRKKNLSNDEQLLDLVKSNRNVKGQVEVGKGLMRVLEDLSLYLPENVSLIRKDHWYQGNVSRILGKYLPALKPDVRPELLRIQKKKLERGITQALLGGKGKLSLEHKRGAKAFTQSWKFLVDSLGKGRVRQIPKDNELENITEVFDISMWNIDNLKVPTFTSANVLKGVNRSDWVRKVEKWVDNPDNLEEIFERIQKGNSNRLEKSPDGFHFKNYENYLRYRKEFLPDQQSLYGVFSETFDRLSKLNALVDTFGVRYMENWDNLLSNVRRLGTDRDDAYINNANNIFDNFIQKSSVPDNEFLARFGRMTRSFGYSMLLWKSNIIAILTDAQFSRATYQQLTGEVNWLGGKLSLNQSYLKGVSSIAGSTLEMLKRGEGNKHIMSHRLRFGIMQRQGTQVEHWNFRRSSASRLSGETKGSGAGFWDGFEGVVDYGADFTTRMSGLSGGTEVRRSVFTSSLFDWLQDKITNKTPWKDLHDNARRAFTRADIDENEYKKLFKVKGFDGKEVDNALKGIKYIGYKEIENVDKVLGGKVHNLINTFSYHAVPASTYTARSLLGIYHHRPGSVLGEGNRGFAQLLSFPISYATTIGYKSRRYWAMRNNTGLVTGLGKGLKDKQAIKYVGGLFLAGVGAKVTKDILDGKEPVYIQDWDKDGHSTYLAGELLSAWAYSGLLPIFGDVLVSSMTKNIKYITGEGERNFGAGVAGAALGVAEYSFPGVSQFVRLLNAMVREPVRASLSNDDIITAQEVAELLQMFPGLSLSKHPMLKLLIARNLIEQTGGSRENREKMRRQISYAKKSHTPYWWKPGKEQPSW